MRAVVIHEDGDRESRVAELLAEVRECVKNGSMRHQGVAVEMRRVDYNDLDERFRRAMLAGQKLIGEQ